MESPDKQLNFNSRETPKLKFKIKTSNAKKSSGKSSAKSNLNHRGDQAGLKLKLVRKDKNSPMLSIQKFIYQQLKTQEPISDLRKLWNKYEKQSCHSLIIKRHSIDYQIFRELVELILETFEPYQINLSPVFFHDTRYVSSTDLVDRMV